MLNKHILFRSKIVRENNKPFVTKTLRNAIMRRSASKKKVNDPWSIGNKLCKEQKNYVVNLSWNAKKYYFQKHMPHG